MLNSCWPINQEPEVLVVLFFNMITCILIHTSGSKFFNENKFEKKQFEIGKSHTKTNHKLDHFESCQSINFPSTLPPIQFKLKVILKRKIK